MVAQACTEKVHFSLFISSIYELVSSPFRILVTFPRFWFKHISVGVFASMSDNKSQQYGSMQKSEQFSLVQDSMQREPNPQQHRGNKIICVNNTKNFGLPK